MLKRKKMVIFIELIVSRVQSAIHLSFWLKRIKTARDQLSLGSWSHCPAITKQSWEHICIQYTVYTSKKKKRKKLRDESCHHYGCLVTRTTGWAKQLVVQSTSWNECRSPRNVLFVGRQDGKKITLPPAHPLTWTILVFLLFFFGTYWWWMLCQLCSTLTRSRVMG